MSREYLYREDLCFVEDELVLCFIVENDEELVVVFEDGSGVLEGVEERDFYALVCEFHRLSVMFLGCLSVKRRKGGAGVVTVLGGSGIEPLLLMVSP